MQIVIDIPESCYEYLRNTTAIVSGQRSEKTLMSVVYNAVAKGTLLSKGHGRLIDADRLREDMKKEYDYRVATSFISFVDLLNCVWLAPTIIEADKEEV